LPPHQLVVFLLQMSALLGLATLLGRGAVRLGWPAIAGELCAGLLLGPSLLGAVVPGTSVGPVQGHLLDAVGQIGVLLLVGLAGIQVDLAMVRRRGRIAANVSFAGMLIPFALGFGMGYLVPGALLPRHVDRLVFALFLGVALCVSAIPVIAKTLIDMNLMHRNVGQLIMSAGIVDDVFGWLMLSIVAALAAPGQHTLRTFLFLVLVIGVSLTVGRPLVRLVLRRVPGNPISVVVTLLLAGAAATQAMGLEAVVGAFAMGMLIGSTGVVQPVRLAPLQSVVVTVLAPIFFATVGLRVDLTSLADPRVLGTGLGVLALAVLGKFVGAYAGARLSRLNNWEALAIGAGMNARGVIEIVVATVGINLGVLSGEMFTVIVLIAVVTSMMAPPILRTAVARIEHTAEERLREEQLGQWRVNDSEVSPGHRKGPGGASLTSG
jgi:Kef-type K+ transport system membrane component KefB